MKRESMRDEVFRELSDGARQYLEVPNSPLSFLIEMKK
jgi:hypothetical protein